MSTVRAQKIASGEIVVVIWLTVEDAAEEVGGMVVNRGVVVVVAWAEEAEMRGRVVEPEAVEVAREGEVEEETDDEDEEGDEAEEETAVPLKSVGETAPQVGAVNPVQLPKAEGRLR